MHDVIFVWLIQNKIHNMKQTALCMTSCLLLLFLATHFYLFLLLNSLCIKYSMYESFSLAKLIYDILKVPAAIFLFPLQDHLRPHAILFLSSLNIPCIKYSMCAAVFVRIHLSLSKVFRKLTDCNTHPETTPTSMGDSCIFNTQNI